MADPKPIFFSLERNWRGRGMLLNISVWSMKEGLWEIMRKAIPLPWISTAAE